jgi:enoyl-[acyl-carrier-protein] reductase (NADH)
MAATVITSSAAANVTFGATAETGIILYSFSRSVQSSKSELMDEDGDIVAVSYYGATATISLSGAINGSSGVATAAVGGLLTLANATTAHGVTGGKIVVDSVSSEAGSDAFRTITIEATQYPSL